MKYMLLTGLLTLGALASTPVCAKPEPAVSAPKATSTLLTDITYAGDKLVAVGKHGTVIYSDDGDNWQQADVPVQSLLTAVYFTDSETGWACGHDGTIIHSDDGGKKWTLQQYLPKLDKPCLDIYFTDNNNGFAIGAYGMYFHTRDGGKSWQSRFLNALLFEEDREYMADLEKNDPEGFKIEASAILPHFNRIMAKGNTLYIVGEMGLLAKSSDLGEHWTRLEEIYPGSFFDIAMLFDGSVIVGGLRGNVFVQAPHSDTWQLIDNPLTATVNSILVLKDRAILLANSGVIYQYQNGQLSHQQTRDGKAILAAQALGERLIMATENGIKIRELMQ